MKGSEEQWKEEWSKRIGTVWCGYVLWTGNSEEENQVKASWVTLTAWNLERREPGTNIQLTLLALCFLREVIHKQTDQKMQLNYKANGEERRVD